MSTEKMRKNFEWWECESDDGPQTDPVWLMYDASRDEYPLERIQGRWCAWKASRVSIELDLSEVRKTTALPDRVWLLGNDVISKIESLGLKVKP